MRVCTATSTSDVALRDFARQQSAITHRAAATLAVGPLHRGCTTLRWVKHLIDEPDLALVEQQRLGDTTKVARRTVACCSWWPWGTLCAPPGSLGDDGERRLQAKRVHALLARVTHEHAVLRVPSAALLTRDAVDALESVNVNVGNRHAETVRVVTLAALHTEDEPALLGEPEAPARRAHVVHAQRSIGEEDAPSKRKTRVIIDTIGGSIDRRGGSCYSPARTRFRAGAATTRASTATTTSASTTACRALLGRRHHLILCGATHILLFLLPVRINTHSSISPPTAHAVARLTRRAVRVPAR